MSVGKKLRQIRRSKDVTQEDLANKVHVAASYLCQIERETKSPSVNLLEEIAEVLGCSVTDFFTEDGETA
ncbi:MAG: helix-turn-helix transcriptional regulator [Clostridia bacterium]|nr:helix-turn-helix transcriptional regulator [Clostridia bacterium]